MIRVKAKRPSVAAARRKAWDAFSKYIRLRDALRTTGTTTKVRCCSCGRIGDAFGHGCFQAGHWLPGRTRGVLFEEQGVHAQCVYCNHFLNGNQLAYTEFMQKTYPKAVLDRLRWKARGKSRSWFVFELQEIEKKYTDLFNELKEANV